ncbi:RDD family protein [Pedobacter nyackensis]|uniref:Uncharacterized membrane protein YckC, RDD family n=1 Tax=Pedobacter nyackensis TaxID=475255 RepID=A0A1W2D0D6_9SPHI|nr:RDD family protein [Pedobacter nyackensis]SMC90941.1 Uncharacterized membrane protein YckC, RDD family [Pedobacter nyackensis]
MDNTIEITQYTVVINGKPEGPYLLNELKGLDILAETFIRKPGMDDYKEAHEFPELRELLGFKRQVTAPQYFASFDQRLLATVVDYFLISCAYVLILLIVFAFVEGKELRMMLLFIALPLIPIARFIYGSIAEASAQQATIGKKLLKIKVTDMEGGRLTLEKSFLRNASKIFSVIPLFSGYLTSFLNRKQQCLHDLIANTLVVKDRLI